MIAVEIKEVEKNFYDKFLERFEKFQIGDQWTALFFRQLATTLDVMNLKDAINLFLSSCKDNNQRKILQSLKNDIELGKTLAEAMQKFKLIFSHNVIQMMVIAQRSGRMQEISEKLAEQLEKDYKSRKKLYSALYYPAFVLVIAMISIMILINIVLPTFASFFESQGSELPLLTQIFLKSAVFISNNIFLIILLILIIIAGSIYIYKKSPQIQMFFATSILKLPFAGRLISQREYMNAFGSLAFLLESGVQIDEAIGMVADSTSNLFFRSIWLNIKNEVERGGRIRSKIFPPEYQGLITTGEVSGTLVEMLKRCEKLAEFEVEELSAKIPVRAEIFGTFFVGIIVALIVFSVILPVLSINI
ncbi:MAG: type II secretion system F family protein [Selenomonadaceae bacterium]|nr:type II secretion system F family protein [Selenomonadaceae bacterium]